MSDLRERPTGTAASPLLTALSVVVVVVLGGPQVWADLSGGGPGLASVYFPVLGVALLCLAVSRRTR